ncbi:hypothetical protein FQA39_LY16880 [Lamprigera yunnana]|nr:hypothetical protein FQA39_LY16880 [Lamprigera yunnana]
MDENEVEYLTNPDARRLTELLAFVDDFLNSNEFTHISRAKEPLEEELLCKCFQCKCTQCWLQPSLAMTPSLLAKKKRELYNIEERYESLRIKKIRQAQEAGIKNIRRKILEAKRAYWCHKKEREMIKMELKERVFEDIRDGKRHINIQCLNYNFPIIDKILSLKRAKRLKKKCRKQRINVILKKILLDFKKDKKSEVIQKRKYKHKAKETEVIEEEETLTATSSSHISTKVAVVVEDIPKQFKLECLTVENEPVKEKKIKSKGENKKEAIGFKLPIIPVVNERERVVLGDQNVNELLKDFKKIEESEKTKRYFQCAQLLMEGYDYPPEPFFRTTPTVIYFQSYVNGKIYKKRVRVHNGGQQTKKCRFQRFQLKEPFLNMFQVEAVGAKNLIPGMKYEFDITFFPEDVHEVLKGNAVFLTYMSSSTCFLQFSTSLICIPAHSSIELYPKNVVFESIPIWEAKKGKAQKKLMLSNVGRKDCVVTVTRTNDLDRFEEHCEKNSSESLLDVFASFNDTYKCAPEENSETIVKNVLDKLIDIPTTFAFDHHFLVLPKGNKKYLNIFLRNVDHVGCFYENYLIGVFEYIGQGLKYMGNQEITITAEVVGSFIEVYPLTIDFQICVFDSVYQLPFKVVNTSYLPHSIGIKFPSSLKEYFSNNVKKSTLRGESSNQFFVKFIPRVDIVRETKYYDASTCILEFPVHIVVTEKHTNVPPSTITIVAILTEANGLSLTFCDPSYSTYYCDNCRMSKDCTCDTTAEYVINMGECSTTETVHTEMQLTNNSYVFQVYGFLNLPKCLQISPNFSFGELMPLETSQLTLSYSPEHIDIPKSTNMSVFHRIKVDTIKSLGALGPIKKPFTCQLIKKLLERMEKEINQPPETLLKKAMIQLVTVLQNEDSYMLLALQDWTQSSSSESWGQKDAPNTSFAKKIADNNFFTDVFSASPESFEEDEVVDRFKMKKTEVCVRATILNPLCDLSHQYVEFPDTPYGSYSLAEIHLKARTEIDDTKCTCTYNRKRTKCATPKYTAHFEIVNDDPQFDVEPTCGTLKSGQMVKLHVIVKPELDRNIVRKTARELKKREILEEWEAAHKKSAKKADSPPLNLQSIPDDVTLSDSELYHAEKEMWRFVEPKIVKGLFCCTLHYTTPDFDHKSEQLYFNTVCRVIRPDFIHNLKTQQIDFGTVLIGQKSRTIIELQNITGKKKHLEKFF